VNFLLELKQRKIHLVPNERKIKPGTIQLLTLFFIVCLPFITLIASELIVRESLSLPFSVWASEFTKRFILNVILLMAVFNLFYILPRKIYMCTSILLSGLFLLFAIANKLKIELRNSPITIGDFALINELRGLNQPVELNIPFIILVSVIMIALIISIFFLIPNRKENWIMKAALSLSSLGCLFVIWTDFPVSPMAKVQFQNTWWQQEVGTMRKGLFGHFTFLAKQTNIEPPEFYSYKKIQELGKTYTPASPENDDKPSVIYLMSEAFTDPFIFGEHHFTEDPIPNFRKLFNESMHGFMYSPEFGGGTANVEFEALTGLSRQFIPEGNVAYQLYIKAPVPSVAYAFRKEGYNTAAIHPYFGWYYQRQSVYRLLGFNQFISGELMDLDHELGSGWGFPKDKNLTDTILSQLDHTPQRDFIHAVSVEAHHPYKPREDSRFLKKGTLPDETRQLLNTYTEYMHSVDIELGRLVDGLKEKNEPALLVFFGDHFPTFNSNDQVYGHKGTGLAPDIQNKYYDFLNSHKLPYFIWSSYDNKSLTQDLSPNQFSAISLEMAGIKGNTVTAVLDKMRGKGQTIIPYNKYQKEMGGLTREMKDLQLLQYDFLHGKKYAKEAIPSLMEAPDEDYFLGQFKEMSFEKSILAGDKYELIAKGVPKYSKLVSNNKKEIPIEWKSSNEGIATFIVDKDAIEEDESYFFVVYDSLGNTLRQTRPFILPPIEGRIGCNVPNTWEGIRLLLYYW
jgi:phosphoglycerol transferase MdoB-like AlkP superfamily enzyme